MKTPENHQKSVKISQKLVKNSKNQPKFTNFHQILPKSTIFHAQKSNLCKESPKIHQIEQKICSILAKNREKCHFLVIFTVFAGKFTPKITFSHVFTAKFDQKIEFLRVFRAKLPNFSKSLLRLELKIGQNVIRKSETLLRFAYFPDNKRDFSAKSLSLLLLALRPRLLNFAKNRSFLTKNHQISVENDHFRTNSLPKSSKMRNFFPINHRIVVTSTILMVLSVIFSGLLTNKTFATSITLTIPGSLSLDVNPNTNSGYAKSSNGNISVTADSPFGYTLSIKSKDSTNGNALMNGGNKLTSITEAMTEDNYKSTGTVNTWGYIPSKINGSANTNVRPGPGTSGETIEKTAVANASSANNYTVALATKINNTLPTGTYKNTFIISAVANSVSYNITYNLNSGSWTGTSPQTGSTPENKVKLSSITPTRTNYTFEGWCTSSTSNETCSGTKYTVGADYPLTNSTNTVTLYAIWKSAKPATPTTMQNFGSYCEWMTTGQTLTLTDSRDSNTYTVAKLNDGLCWMTQNLRLGKTSTMSLSSSTSDISSSYTLPASSTSGFSDNTAQNIFVSSNTSYGGYYTWPAATAGTNPSSDEASHSICPKGWRLPTKVESGTLTNNYTYTTIQQSPANFVLAGYYDSSSLVGSDTRGFWWSSTAHSSPRAFSLGLYPSYSSFATYNSYKRNGYSIRCVSRQ